MSQNKTVVPGMSPFTQDNPSENVYVKNTTTGISSKKTYCPEMGMHAPGYESTQQNAGSNQKNVNEKPVVGFLYSISKRGIGEFWPLHVGPNKIGRSKKCDICLSEGSVSEEHAEVVIRNMKNPEKLVASITDYRSTCGTMINGVSIAFNAQECVTNDIITIGENYELLIILIDAKKMNLHVAENYIHVAEENTPVNPYSKDNENQNPFPDMNYNYNNNTPLKPTESNYYTGPETGGTVPLDGSKAVVHGNTILLK